MAQLKKNHTTLVTLHKRHTRSEFHQSMVVLELRQLHTVLIINHNGELSFNCSANLEVNDKHTLTIMKEMTTACQQNLSCLKLDPFDKVACIRRCVSPLCYAKIYNSSPLEPGEIDVNYPRYKSCFHKQWKNKYRNTLNVV